MGDTTAEIGSVSFTWKSCSGSKGNNFRRFRRTTSSHSTATHKNTHYHATSPIVKRYATKKKTSKSSSYNTHQISTDSSIRAPHTYDYSKDYYYKLLLYYFIKLTKTTKTERRKKLLARDPSSDEI